MSKKKTYQQFVSDLLRIHGNKYDISKVEYVNSSTKICLICHEMNDEGIEHGEFWITPNNLLRGQGCPKCGKKRISENKKKTTMWFVDRAKQIHKDKYDYSKVEYVKNNIKVCIICPEHGEFWQTPSVHLSGCGCPKCVGKYQTTEEFIMKSKELFKNIDYSKVVFRKVDEKVCLFCKEKDENNREHGEFWQTPHNHLKGHRGCPKCAIYDKSKKLMHDENIFIEKINKLFPDKYDTSKITYNGSKEKIEVICKKHGSFWIRPDKLLQGEGCPKCGHICSKAEDEIKKFITEISNLKVEERLKTIIPPYELDIYIPEKKLAIEYNGLKWHSYEYNENKDYHLNKTELCEKQGIRLIHIFEDEWQEHCEIVKTKLKHILGFDNDLPKVFARKCVVKEITNKEARLFLEKNHIQGFTKSTIYLGCFYNNDIVGAMSFKKERNDSDKWELTRFASDINKHCVGVAGKLFKCFVENYNPSEIKSFADRRWSTNNENLYIKLGFKLDKILKPDYHYVYKGQRIHKFNFRKQKLHKKYGLPLTMTEEEMCKKLNFYRIYDCGLIKYIWNRK